MRGHAVDLNAKVVGCSAGNHSNEKRPCLLQSGVRGCCAKARRHDLGRWCLPALAQDHLNCTALTDVREYQAHVLHALGNPGSVVGRQSKAAAIFYRLTQDSDWEYVALL